MTIKDKELLLKDLSARLPYGVKLDTPDGVDTLGNVDINEGWVNASYDVDEVKPYLRPMCSITEEEIKELSEIDMKRVIFSSRHLTWHLDGEVIDYLNKKMFDWRGLIEKGLALKAPEGMYD